MTTKAIIGLVMLVLGLAGAGFTFAANSSTPLQLGPVPFFCGAFLALVGLILLLVGL
jgi:hypothetical protein